jgi:hypothetical protein
MRRLFVLSFTLIMLFGMQVFPQTEYTKRSKNEVREGPGSYYQLLKVLPRGVAIPVLKRDGGWVNFRPGERDDAKSVWISKNCLVEGKQVDLLRDLKIEWLSPKASPSAVAAAIRGFALRYGKVSPAVLDTLVDLQGSAFSTTDFEQFVLGDQRKQPATQAMGNSEIGNLMKESESSSSEDALGAGIAARLASPGLVSNRSLVKYVNLIAAKLGAASPWYDVPLKVFVLKGDEPRAYAIPGGYIFLGKGLIDLCEDEAELAAVIGHEMTHLAARHAMSEEFQRRNRVRMDEAFSELEEELGQKPDSSESDLEEMIQEAYDEVVKPRLQVYEEEADRGAVLLLAAVGYDPKAVSDIVKKTGRAIKNRAMDWTENPFLHLDFEQRNKELLKFLQGHKLYGGGIRNGERFKRMVQ